MKQLLLIAYIFLAQNFSVVAQEVIDSKGFDDTDGIVLIEFWEEWNKKNDCSWLEEIEGVRSYRMKMSSNLAKEMEIKVLPTIVLFQKQEYINKWEGDISFRLPLGTKKKVQDSVDKLNFK